MAKQEPIVMMDSAEAATYRTVSGWVSRDGVFFGEDERTARYAGCTHRPCDTCGGAVAKGHLRCGQCQRVKDVERYNALPVVEWKEGPLCLFDGDEFFFDEDDVIEYAEEHEVDPKTLLLVTCKPVYAEEIDPADIYTDDIPEDGELPGYVLQAFVELNSWLSTKQEPICWMPAEARIDVAALVDELVAEARGEE